MILVTVGTQFFDELIAEVDRLVATGVIQDDVYAQIGLCKTPPKHLRHVRFDRKLTDRMYESDLIITHAGTGCVIEAIESGKPFIAVVNDSKAGDHQREFLEVLETTHDFCWIASPSELESALSRARPGRSRHENSIHRLCDDIERELMVASRLRSRGWFQKLFGRSPESTGERATASVG